MSNIIGFFGLMSSGKGVSSTRFLREQRKKFYKKVISNCVINDKDVVQLTTDELYEKSRTPEFFDDSYLYITELHTIIDSRRSSSLLNTNFTMFLTQLGKRDCFVIYDSQLEGQIDLRMREFTPLRIICTKFIFQNGKWQKPEFGTPRKLKTDILIVEVLNFTDLKGQQQMVPLRAYTPTQDDFDYYDTSEVIMLDREKHMSSRRY